jgi:Rod binding domain-containing protein
MGSDFRMGAVDPARVAGLGDALLSPTSDGKLNQVKALAQSGDTERSRQAAMQFEALLLHQMFAQMWKSVPKSELLGGGREDEYYRDMLNEALADSVAKGNGIGIRDVVFKELSKSENKHQK